MFTHPKTLILVAVPTNCQHLKEIGIPYKACEYFSLKNIVFQSLRYLEIEFRTT
jgi:hypothetical protein